MGTWTSFIIWWVICGIFSYGIIFADFVKSKHYIEEKHKSSAILIMFVGLIFGIPGLIFSLIVMDWWKYGLKFW